MSFLGYFTDEELVQKLSTNKVEISMAINRLFPFLHGLRDKALITNEKFNEIKQVRKQIDTSEAVYLLLKWLEKSDPSTIRKFWSNLFQDYNLQEYPKLLPLKTSFIEGSDQAERVVFPPPVCSYVLTGSFSGPSSDLGEDRGKCEPADSPVMKSKTLKRKHPDEECAHHSASERTPKRSKDRKPERSKDRKPERSKDRKPERSKDRKPERSKDRKPERSKDRKPERSKDRKPERSKDRKPEHGKDPNRRNGVKQPQMTKGEDDKPKVGKTRNVCSLLDQVDFASSELPVSCGNITGTLDKKRLALGSRMKCIMSKNVWYTPREFEVLGGRANSKNWKLSVRCKGHQLSKLIQLEYLVCDTRGTRQRLNAAKAEEHFGLMKESTIKCESGPSGEHRKGVKPRDTDMDEFSSNKLPVTCGSMYGILYKYRFTTGLHGKCIRTKTKWLTPSEFEEMSGIKKDIQYWKRNIYCKSEILGKLTLGKLIQKGYLKLHKCDCLCKRCMSTDIDTEENDDECTVCEDGGQLICCEECPKAFHCLCHVPSLDPAISEKWTCTFCKMDKLSNNKTRAGVSNSEFDVYQAAMTPEHILKCEYILLRMYCKTEGVVFEKNPCDTIPEYSHIIENPMWLCRVKEKLVTEEYQTVGGFIDDVRLIFHNCARFNQETDFESIGRKLSDEFEEVMKQVFDISNNNFYTPPMDE